MIRIAFYWLAVVVPLLIVVWALTLWPPAAWLLLAVVPLIAIGLRDAFSRTNVLNNYPVIGHLRYLLEFIRPELRQYFFESNTSGRPFNREQRDLIVARASGQGDAQPFGTVRDFDEPGFDSAPHSLAVKEVDDARLRVEIGGPQCRRPYLSSRLNISAMSFGSLSANAVLAMNKGASLGDFAQNTGEGGLSDYHLRYGADVIWEIGTAYFGCRTPRGRFDAGEFADKAADDRIKMIELKLSQGAKPSHGGLLPGGKVSEEIARVREIEEGKDCLSPPTHPEFDDPTGLLEFVARLRDLTDGKPVGFKLCLGRRTEFMGICKAMLETGIRPDFITVDGAEGGTGAAPLEYSDRLGTYIDDALPFVHNTLVGAGLRQDLRVIASGKVAMGFDLVLKHALGADACNAARPFMFAVGCIQARRCNTNLCPTGVTSQDPRRSRAIHVESKAVRVRNYHHSVLRAFRDMTGALGCDDPADLTPDMIYSRTGASGSSTYADLHPPLAPNELVEGSDRTPYADDWRRATSSRF